MKDDLIKAKKLLSDGGFTCVLCKDETVYTSSRRGVKPLLEWYENGTDLAGFSAADKVVGKATAFLYALLGVKAVYANVISRPAAEVLRESGIVFECGEIADNIINRSGDGICPFEKAVLGFADKHEAYRAIVRKMNELKN